MNPGNGLNELQTSILMTLAYADQFDHPLTLEELHFGLFTPREVALEDLAAALREDPLLRALVGRKDCYYFLEGRHALPAVRTAREVLHQILLARAATYLGLLRLLPTLRGVFLTGASAFGAPPDETLDLLLLARPGWRWTTQACAGALKTLLGLGRSVRLRFVLEEDRLDLPERDIYAASRLASLRPLFTDSQPGAVRAANAWGAEFFANAFSPRNQQPSTTNPQPRLLADLVAGFAAPFERVLEGLIGTRQRPPNHARMEDFDRAWRRQLAKAEAMTDYLALSGSGDGKRPVGS